MLQCKDRASWSLIIKKKFTQHFALTVPPGQTNLRMIPPVLYWKYNYRELPLRSLCLIKHEFSRNNIQKPGFGQYRLQNQRFCTYIGYCKHNYNSTNVMVQLFLNKNPFFHPWKLPAGLYALICPRFAYNHGLIEVHVQAPMVIT